MKDQESVVREQKIFLSVLVFLWLVSLGVPVVTGVHLHRSIYFMYSLIFGGMLSALCMMRILESTNRWNRKIWLCLILFPLYSFIDMIVVGSMASGEKDYFVIEKPNGIHEVLTNESRFNFSDVVVATFPKKFSITNSWWDTDDFIETTTKNFIIEGHIYQANFTIPADRETVRTLFLRFGTMDRLKMAIKQEVAEAVKKALADLEPDKLYALKRLTLRFNRPLKVFEGTEAGFDGKRQIEIENLRAIGKPLPSDLTIRVR